jgi:hypothetical protein
LVTTDLWKFATQSACIPQFITSPTENTHDMAISLPMAHKLVATHKPGGGLGSNTLENNIWTQKQLPCGWGAP